MDGESIIVWAGIVPWSTLHTRSEEIIFLQKKLDGQQNLLNIIENCWDELVRTVYKNSRQFKHISDIKMYYKRIKITKEKDKTKKSYLNQKNDNSYKGQKRIYKILI